MAYLLSTGATGNWTSASTWSLCDGTNFIDSRGVSSGLGATLVAGTSFSWASAAPTLQGIAVQLSARAAAGTGTMTAELYNVTGATSVRSVTVNVSDITSTYGSVGSMWTYFKFASTVTLATGTNYAIRLSCNSTNQVYCYALATTNWSYMLVTTTNQAPAASDSVIVTGTHTGAGAFTSNVVTLDNTSATQYGNIFISNYGTLQIGTAANTNYRLANNGVAGTVFIVGYGGTFNVGQFGAYLDSTSTLTITLNCASALSTPILVYGVVYLFISNAGGPYNIFPFNKLAADVAAGATSSTVTDSSTGWKSGDQIVVPSTTRTATQYEVITLSANQSGTSLTHGAYVNAHGGNASTLVQADLANISRNCVIKSGSTTFRSNIQVQTNAQVYISGVRFQDLGTGILATNAGIGVPALNASYGIFQITNSVMLNTVTNSTTLSGTGLFCASNVNTYIAGNIFYNLGWTAVSASGSIFQLDVLNMFIGNYSSTYACTSTYCGGGTVFASNTATTAAYSGGFLTNVNQGISPQTYNSYYSNSSYGLYFVGTALSTGMSYFNIWRNNVGGLVINNNALTFPRTLTWDFTYCYIFGNTSYGVTLAVSLYTKVFFFGGAIYGGSTLTQAYGFYPNGFYIDSVVFSNMGFGYDNNGNSSPHTTANLFTPNRQSSLWLDYCNFSGTEIAGQTPAAQGSNSQSLSFVSTGHNRTNLHKQWLLNGTISGDNAIYNSASPSIRMTPISATYKLTTATIKVPVKSGTSCTISLYVRKSVAGDGTAYNGSAPRLMWVFNPGMGNNAETAVATSVAAAGTWELLTYTTPTIATGGVAEFYVDCDGTTGWINVDDVKSTPTADSRGTDYTAPNGFYIEAGNKTPGGSYGFVL
jgi:hypothetical protein